MAAEANVLSGRLAVVTGGGGGIGGAVCKLLAKKGARVVVAGRGMEKAAALAASLPVFQGCLSHQAMQVDVTSAASVEALFQSINSFSQVTPSIVVNCAGFADPKMPAAVDITEDIFDETVRVNFKGTFLVSRAAVRSMLDACISDGAIVNLSSRSANGASPRLSVYAACKAAVISFTQSMATELALRGIRCNAVLPGLTVSPPVLSMPDEMRRAACVLIPLRRTAQPREVAEVVVFLCCPQSSYVVGSALVVAGGRQ